MFCGYPDMRLRMLALENRAGIADFNCLYEWLLAEPAIQEEDASVPAGDLVLRRAPLELSARVRYHIRDLIGSHLSLFTIVEAKAARLVVLDRLNEAAKPEAVASIYGASAFSGMEMQGWDGIELAPGDLAGLRIIGGGADRRIGRGRFLMPKIRRTAWPRPSDGNMSAAGRRRAIPMPAGSEAFCSCGAGAPLPAAKVRWRPWRTSAGRPPGHRAARPLR